MLIAFNRSFYFNFLPRTIAVAALQHKAYARHSTPIIRYWK